MTAHHLLIKAATRKPAHRRPFWIINQTSIFKELIKTYKQQNDYVSILTNSQHATEISLHPFYELKIDAIELFTSPFLPVLYMNLDCVIDENSVKIQKPIRNSSQVNNLHIPDINTNLQFIIEILENLRIQTFDAPIIGRCAGVFSLTSLLLDGVISNEMPFTKAVLYSHEQAFVGLLNKINNFMKNFIQAQIDAGAEAICIDDPLISSLSFEDFERFYLPTLISLITSLVRDEIPLIYNAPNVHPLMDLLKHTDFNVITVGNNHSIQNLVTKYEDRFTFQGNFDPLILLGTPETIEAKITNHLQHLGRAHGIIGSFSANIPQYIKKEKLKFFVRKYQELSSSYATS